jgi:hypothetical protein
MRINAKIPFPAIVYSTAAHTRVGTKTLFLPFVKTKTFTKGVTVFAKFSHFFAKVFCEKFSRKPQSDEKWYKTSVEKEYMEPDPWFF